MSTGGRIPFMPHESTDSVQPTIPGAEVLVSLRDLCVGKSEGCASCPNACQKPAPEERYRSLPVVYVAGPYTNPDPVANVHRTAKIATAIVETGALIPVVPHLSLLWHAVEPRHVEWWYEYDLYLLARCDAVYRLEGASTGADREVDVAYALGLPVFYESDPAALLEWAARWERQ